MLCNTPAQFPDEKMGLGRYLGPSIVVGPAMMAKLMVCNGDVISHSPLQGLTLAERESPKDIELRRKIDVTIETNLGPKATVNDFDATEVLTLEWEI